MASNPFLVVVFVFHLAVFAPAVATEQRRTKPLCHEDESFALLQFKESLISDCSEFGYSYNYSKVSFWVSESINCCEWSGVKCDENTGHVVSLDLSSRCLLGTINSNSSLFKLVHIQRLNLAYNDFSYSKIPASFRHFSRLTGLNLSSTSFYGQIPLEILELSELVFLDLSRNELDLQESGLRSMAQNLTNLKELHLTSVNILSIVPKTFTNLSSLTSLFLDGCGLHGEFPNEIFHLPNLQSIDLGFNSNLKGSLPEFNQSNLLGSLELSYTSFSGKLPDSISNLINLQVVGFYGCNFFGPIPPSFGNLTHLVSLYLSENRFLGEFPTLIFHFPNLMELVVSFNENFTLGQPKFNRSCPIKVLSISSMSFSSEVQCSIVNLKSLSSFTALGCNFSGPISSSLGNLTQLTNLVLEGNNLNGSFEELISKLVNLEYLQLDSNNLSGIVEFDLFLKLINLRFLYLSKKNISLPSSLGNLTQLNGLVLEGNNLHGSFKELISKLVNLQYLQLVSNNLSGIVEFDLFLKLKNLHFLYISNSNISLPLSIDNFTQLSELELEGNNLHGSLGELMSKLVHLVNLRLSSNKLSGTVDFDVFLKLKNLHFLYISNNNISLPSSLGNLTQLSELVLEGNNLHGSFEELISKLMNLENLQLESNKLSGIVDFDSFLKLKNLRFLYIVNTNISLPSSLSNLTQLTKLVLEENNLHGSFEELISKLVNLEYLVLDSNNLSGIVEFGLFLKLKNLRSLYIFNSNISLLTKSDTKATFPMLEKLILNDCHLREFPNFLRNQGQLQYLDLSQNEIHGQVPKWMQNVITNTQHTLDLSFNFLTGFDEFLVFPFSSKLEILRLDSNKLQGSIPIPPSSIIWYSAPNNNLTGKLSHLICKLSSIIALDLSNNSLSGMLPECLGNLSNTLLVLNLHGNNFHGTIPKSFPKGNELKMFDLSQNQLQGPIPRSLVHYTNLEVLNLGYNQINDTVPFWLGVLPELKVLILRSNRFHGIIGNPNTNFDFSSLHVVDLSNNDITGKLPSQLFENWKAMQILNEMSLTYMEASTQYGYYSFSMTFFNKGNEMVYKKILDYFMAIDLSKNRFEGEIPEVVGLLRELKLLNLSNNFLTGHIPLSLGNLIELESLDLSHNKLSGVIPLQLTQLNFLAVFSVSHNYLIGLIPFGKQFGTFPNTSFSDNPELCGSPLIKKCESFEHSHSPTSSFVHNDNWKSLFGFNWKEVVMGYGCGFVVGLVLGITKKHDWFATFVMG